jgi:hypothetical protein
MHRPRDRRRRSLPKSRLRNLPGLICCGPAAPRLSSSAVVRRGPATRQEDTNLSDDTGTVRLHRVVRAPPERVYRALLDPDAMCKWTPPHGFTGKVHHSDVRVGGSYRMSFTNFSTGRSHSFGGTYVEFCYAGWQESLLLLAQLVEPEIPDGA